MPSWHISAKKGERRLMYKKSLGSSGQWMTDNGSILASSNIEWYKYYWLHVLPSTA